MRMWCAMNSKTEPPQSVDEKLLDTLKKAASLARKRGLSWDNITFEMKRLFFKAVLDSASGVNGYEFATKGYERLAKGRAFCLVYTTMLHDPGTGANISFPLPLIVNEERLRALQSAKEYAEREGETFNSELATLAFDLELAANRRF